MTWPKVSAGILCGRALFQLASACSGSHIAHPKEPAALGGGAPAQTGDTKPVKVDTRLMLSLPLALSGLRQVATSPDFDFLPKREEKE